MKDPKEYAKELVEKFGIELSPLVVQYIINSNPHSNPFNTEVHSTMEFWESVKQEIIN